MTEIDEIRARIMNDPENRYRIGKGYKPLFRAHPDAKILIVTHPPSLIIQRAGELFADRNGAIIRNWLGIEKNFFHQSNLIAALPMDFFFTGRYSSCDLPPRSEFTRKWHPELLQCMPNIELTVLVGKYAQRHYLQDRMKQSVSDTICAYEEYLPDFVPLVHPSIGNQRWISANSFYKNELVPRLQEVVKQVLL